MVGRVGMKVPQWAILMQFHKRDAITVKQFYRTMLTQMRSVRPFVAKAMLSAKNKHFCLTAYSHSQRTSIALNVPQRITLPPAVMSIHIVDLTTTTTSSCYVNFSDIRSCIHNGETSNQLKAPQNEVTVMETLRCTLRHYYRMASPVLRKSLTIRRMYADKQ